MPKVEIVGIPPWDGVYEFDNEFTNREYHVIYEIANVAAGEIEREARRGNMDLMVAFAVVALAQHDKIVLVDDLWDAKAGKIIIHGDAEESESAEDPPLPAPEPVANDDSGTSSDRSGSASSGPSGDPAVSPLSTGEPG